jgi:hypothetical protein
MSQRPLQMQSRAPDPRKSACPVLLCRLHAARRVNSAKLGYKPGSRTPGKVWLVRGRREMHLQESAQGEC